MRPARPATCGSHVISHRLNVRCPNVGAARVTPRVHADRRSVVVLIQQCSDWGGTTRGIGRRSQSRTRLPHFAQSPSANATGERALVNRSPFERVAIAGCFISACLAARCTWLDPSVAEAFLACALDASQDASGSCT